MKQQYMCDETEAPKEMVLSYAKSMTYPVYLCLKPIKYL